MLGNLSESKSEIHGHKEGPEWQKNPFFFVRLHFPLYKALIFQDSFNTFPIHNLFAAIRIINSPCLIAGICRKRPPIWSAHDYINDFWSGPLKIEAVTTTSTICSPSLAGRCRKTQSVETTSRTTAPLVTLILVINYETWRGSCSYVPFSRSGKS
ncbi:hypothetical protein F0562_000537 [Nyssa sinensis]|uniref:Uncharacterized protein n=1 Tax=Nyssa sinensis TaxID=561372 RepID=A0A5J5C0C0_9ASTE|nr:hypothetical protein F0562_000537 [Nyssa sinensis]